MLILDLIFIPSLQNLPLLHAILIVVKTGGETATKPFYLIENVFATIVVRDAVLNLNWMSILTR